MKKRYLIAAHARRHGGTKRNIKIECANRGVQNVKNIELKLAKQFFSLPWSILMTTKNFSSLGQREDPALAHEDFTI